MAALLCAASFSSASNNPGDNLLHLGFSAVGNYIGIWHLSNDVYVKNENTSDTTGKEIVNTSSKQWLSGGHKLHGVGGSLGVSGIKDINSWLQIRLDLFISLRYRFVEALEHRNNTTETIYDGEMLEQEKDKGSKGTYDISLKYWHIDAPVSARFLLPNEYFIESGILFSYILAANLKIKLISLDFDSYAAGIELGLVGGFGKAFTFQNRKRLDVFSRFVFGVTPLLSDRVKNYLYDQIKPREWLLQVGTTFYIF